MGVEAMTQYLEEKYTIGSITALIPEATDASASDDPASLLVDGGNGDTEFPHGKLKALTTVGEYDKDTGAMIVGVPDGLVVESRARQLD